MRRFVLGIAVIGSTIALSAHITRADLVAVGDPSDTGSWAQQFNETGVGPYTAIAVEMYSAGGAFQVEAGHNAIWSFTNSSWHVVSQTPSPQPTFVSAAGAAVNNMNFYIDFAGSTSDWSKTKPMQFGFVAWDASGKRLEQVLATYNGGWSFATDTNPPISYAAAMGVPIPHTALAGAGLLGLLGLAGVRRKLGAAA